MDLKKPAIKMIQPTVSKSSKNIFFSTMEEEILLKQEVQDKQEKQLLHLYHLWEIKQMDCGWDNIDVNQEHNKQEVLKNKLWIGDEVGSNLDKSKVTFDAVVSIGGKYCEYKTYPNVNYFRIVEEDTRASNLSQYFDKVSDFIHNNNKVLVHCQAGVSRSATICIAYLLKFHKLDFFQAYMVVKIARPIIAPNMGFIKQLIEYQKKKTIKK